MEPDRCTHVVPMELGRNPVRVDSAVADEVRVRRDEWRMTMTAFVKFAGIAAGLAMVAGHAVAADIPQTAPPPAPAPVYAPPGSEEHTSEL